MSAPAIDAQPPQSRWLPPIGSPRYYLLLGAIAIFVLGPLGGVTWVWQSEVAGGVALPGACEPGERAAVTFRATVGVYGE